MAEKDTEVAEWSNYSEQQYVIRGTEEAVRGSVNSPESTHIIDSAVASQYSSLGNAFRDIKRAVKKEFQNLGWNSSNTFVNTASGDCTWDIVENNSEPTSLLPYMAVRIKDKALVGWQYEKAQLITRGMKVLTVTETVDGDIYYWVGTIESVTFNLGTPSSAGLLRTNLLFGNTRLICSNVHRLFVEVNANTLTDINKSYLNKSVDTAPDANGADDYTDNPQTESRGGFPEYADTPLTEISLWDAENNDDVAKATLYISTYREKMVPHDPDQIDAGTYSDPPNWDLPQSQAYAGESLNIDADGDAWDDINNPEKNGLLNEQSSYPTKSQQGSFFVTGAAQRFAVVLPKKEHDKRYSLFFTPLESFSNWTTTSATVSGDIKERLAYNSANPGKNCYLITKITKYLDRFVVEFRNPLPTASQSADIDSGNSPAILWEWKLVRDFRR